MTGAGYVETLRALVLDERYAEAIEKARELRPEVDELSPEEQGRLFEIMEYAIMAGLAKGDLVEEGGKIVPAPRP